MASASAGLELPATSLIAPLLGRIAVSRREAPLPRALITRRRQGWQYDGQPGSGFVPVDSGDSGVAPSPSPSPSLASPSPTLARKGKDQTELLTLSREIAANLRARWR